MTSPKLTKAQQLKIIQGFCLLWEDGRQDEPQSIIDGIYKISHLNGTCKNEHLDWHREGFNLIKEFNEKGII